MNPVLGADTWGISGPAFLGWYVVAGGVVAVVAHNANRAVSGETRQLPPRADQLTPVQLGLLGGGDTHAVTVALTELRTRDLLDANGRALVPTGLTKPAAHLDAVTRAVLTAATAQPGGRLAPATLATDPAVAAALAAERGLLEDYGLLARARPRSNRVLGYLAAAALVVLGVARIVAGAANHHSIALLVVVTVAAGVIVPVCVHRARADELTRNGRLDLQAVRRSHDYLEPKLDPAWTSYGPAKVVLATALFGGAVIFAADPFFAATVGASDAELAGNGPFGSGFGGGGGGGGDGDGCGGGGCGGGCGGGGCGGGCGG